MTNEKTTQVHQKDCEACDQVITLSEPNALVRYCLRCTEELEAWFDSQPDPTDEEIVAWANLWALKENE